MVIKARLTNARSKLRLPNPPPLLPPPPPQLPPTPLPLAGRFYLIQSVFLLGPNSILSFNPSVPTTMSKSTSTTAGASGVDNAASDPTGAVGNKAGSDAVANGASSLVARPFEIAAGLLAAGAVAFL